MELKVALLIVLAVVLLYFAPFESPQGAGGPAAAPGMRQADDFLDDITQEGLMVIGVCVLLAIADSPPCLSHPPNYRYESSCIATLRTINTAQQWYRAGVPGSRYGDLATLSAVGIPPYLDTVVGSGTKSGYTFVITIGAGGQSYSVRGAPANIGVSGNRYFYTDDIAVIYHATYPEVDARSSPID